jgi:two-component system, OmpR family, sensor kinase
VSIRWRLTLWFTLILLIILIFSDIVLNTLLQNYLLNDVDVHLQSYAAQVHGSVNTQTVPGQPDYAVIHSILPPINEFSSPGTYIQIIDTSGVVVVKSDSLGNQDLPVDQGLIGKAVKGGTDIQTVPAGDNIQVRIMVSPLYMIDHTMVLEVAQSLTTVENAQHQFRFALIAGTSVALLLTTILGAIIVRRTLEPVESITSTARNIEESSNLNRRVGYRGPQDEIGRLATTFDHMIERLEKSFDSQKHFIADASHELRTPLTVIQGNLDLVKRNISEEDRKESLRAIESEAKRLTRIASDLLLLAEVEAGQVAKKENVLLKAIITEEQKRAQLLAGNYQIILGRVEDLSVKGDTYKLSQVLGNLVDNAIKYTPVGGTITLSVFRDKNWARLEVSDTGIGIAPENLPYLFDRFYRVDNARSRTGGGTGLGLAIVKGIVDQIGGKVTVTSEPGKGSTFTVWLNL